MVMHEWSKNYKGGVNPKISSSEVAVKAMEAGRGKTPARSPAQPSASEILITMVESQMRGKQPVC